MEEREEIKNTKTWLKAKGVDLKFCNDFKSKKIQQQQQNITEKIANDYMTKMIARNIVNENN